MKDLTAPQAAERLGLHVITVRRLLNKGALRGYRVGDGPAARYRITPEALEAFRQGTAS